MARAVEACCRNHAQAHRRRADHARGHVSAARIHLVDSTPVGCGCPRETANRSDLAGWAQYGYCASHSRYFWGLRLHLVCTLGGLPVLFALTGAKADERETLRDMCREGLAGGGKGRAELSVAGCISGCGR